VSGALAFLPPQARAHAQTVQVGAVAAAVTNSEVDETRQAKGLGAGASARLERDRLRLDVRYLHAALRSDFSIQPDFDVDALDLRLTYRWRPYLGAEVGLARRFVSPELAAQEVGLLRVGLVSEARLTRVAEIWARGACLPLSRFSGGGHGGLGVELGLGVAGGPANGRLQGFAEFTYQRINRETAAPAPLQYSEGLLGVRWRP
jgi:hypothetical protein